MTESHLAPKNPPFSSVFSLRLRVLPLKIKPEPESEADTRAEAHPWEGCSDVHLEGARRRGEEQEEGDGGCEPGVRWEACAHISHLGVRFPMTESTSHVGTCVHMSSSIATRPPPVPLPCASQGGGRICGLNGTFSLSTSSHRVPFSMWMKQL